MMIRYIFIALSIVLNTSWAQDKSTILHISSKDIVANQTIRKEFTCDGNDISPQISWSNIPKNTQELVLVVSDPDAPGGVFYHWVVYNISPTINGFEQDIKNKPAAIRIGKNDFGNEKYNGPCPPTGKPHHYIFSVYALDKHLNLREGESGSRIVAESMKHLIEKAELTAIYKR